MKKTIIFDLDGTIADISHRRVYLEGNSDWSKFNAEIGNDIPNAPIVELYLSLWGMNKYNIIIVTGRSEEYRPITEHWLTWNEIPFMRLIMRKRKDNRSDCIIKQEILNLIISEGADILFSVDDRSQVVDMWRNNGITCLQCAPGDF